MLGGGQNVIQFNVHFVTRRRRLRYTRPETHRCGTAHLHIADGTGIGGVGWVRSVAEEQELDARDAKEHSLVRLEGHKRAELGADNAAHRCCEQAVEVGETRTSATRDPTSHQRPA